MEKSTIELSREAEFYFDPKKYNIHATMDHNIVDERGFLPQILDGMVNWSQEEVNRGRKIYRHTLMVKFENIDEKKTKCERVMYLDVFHQ